MDRAGRAAAPRADVISPVPATNGGRRGRATAQLVFSQRPPKGAWRLIVDAGRRHGRGGHADATGDAAEWQGAVSPDGKSIAFVSDRDVRAEQRRGHLGARTGAPPTAARDARDARGRASRVIRRGRPTAARVAYAAARSGAAGICVATIRRYDGCGRSGWRCGTARRRQRGRGAGGAAGTRRLAPRESWPPVISACRPGRPTVRCWRSRRSRRRIAGYNGNPNRNDNDPPTVFAGANQFALWRVLAPRAVDEGAASARAGRDRCRALDVRVRSGLADAEGPVLRERAVRRGVGRAARQVPAADGAGQGSRRRRSVIDQMIAEQPPIKPPLPAVARDGGVRPSARVGGRRGRARARRQRRRCRHRHRVRARRRRARRARASAATARRFCFSRAWPSRSSSNTRT